MVDAAEAPGIGAPLASADGRVGERWALVLAGDGGTRFLRELTRAITGAPIPKEYCRILGDRSLLETTLDRVAGFAPPTGRSPS
jgi:hypothetical protein